MRNVFTSYDKVSGKVPTDGSYEISALVDTKSETWFMVVVKLNTCPTCSTPAVVSVTVYFHKLVVLVNQDCSVWVRSNGWWSSSYISFHTYSILKQHLLLLHIIITGSSSKETVSSVEALVFCLLLTITIIPSH